MFEVLGLRVAKGSREVARVPLGISRMFLQRF